MAEDWKGEVEQRAKEAGAKKLYTYYKEGVKYQWTPEKGAEKFPTKPTPTPPPPPSEQQRIETTKEAIKRGEPVSYIAPPSGGAEYQKWRWGPEYAKWKALQELKGEGFKFEEEEKTIQPTGFKERFIAEFKKKYPKATDIKIAETAKGYQVTGIEKIITPGKEIPSHWFTFAPTKAYGLGLISEREYKRIKGEDVTIGIEPPSITTTKEQYIKGLESLKIKWTGKVTAGPGVPKIEAWLGLEKEEQLAIEKIAQDPGVKASYIFAKDWFGIGTLAEWGVTALTGGDWKKKREAMMRAYASELYHMPKEKRVTYPIEIAGWTGAKATLFALAWKPIGTGVVAKVGYIAGATTMRGLYGFGLGTQIGTTIREPTAEQFARTVVFSTPFLFGITAKALQGRLPGTTVQTIGFKAFKIKGKGMKPLYTQKQIEGVTKAWGKGVAKHQAKVEQQVIKKIWEKPISKPVSKPVSEAWHFPKTTKTITTRTGQQLLVKQVKFDQPQQFPTQTRYSGLEEWMGWAKKTKLQWELTYEYMTYPPRVLSLKLTPMVKPVVVLQKPSLKEGLKLLTTQKTGVKLITELKQLIGLKQISATMQKLKPITITSQKQRLLTRTATKQISKQILSQITKQKTLQKQQTILGLKQSLLQRTAQVSLLRLRLAFKTPYIPIRKGRAMRILRPRILRISILPKPGRKILRKRLLADLLSVTKTKARFGKATHPRPTKKRWKEAEEHLYLKIPTVEMMKKGLKKLRII